MLPTRKETPMSKGFVKKAVISLLAIVLAFGAGTPAFAASADEAAAQEVADMIDAIYVQARTEETDAQCDNHKNCDKPTKACFNFADCTF